MDNNFLTDALNLTMFGMGFVFVFLALMVIFTNLMSVLISKIQPAINRCSIYEHRVFTVVILMKKQEAIIEAAIKMHIKR